ncbi:hypothetical protein ICN32_09175 [Polynucleobacter wuianus]|uniref:hypothetical protein n=1 Tax=Polynucleobacter wuianus TaxID=1743168 RepID=UPI001C0D4B9E|nr:hypothetical protein [Polynucleobacter wuianus]MBU3610726.1 hypothetical protein [Polynucleobacter wuianus]
MTNTSTTPPIKHGFKEGLIEEAKKAFALTVYFGTWFCSLTFLALTSLDERPIPLTPFGMSLIKAALCAKFMLIAQAVFPIKVDKNNGIIKSLFIESMLYLIIVLMLNYLEAGIDGLIHGKEFLISMTAFGQNNPLRVFAMAMVYWLIVWPYLVFIGMKLKLGSNATVAILFGSKS